MKTRSCSFSCRVVMALVGLLAVLASGEARAGRTVLEGSATIVFRKDLLPVGLTYTQHADADAGDYWIMNRPSDGSERKVINQLLFVGR